MKKYWYTYFLLIVPLFFNNVSAEYPSAQKRTSNAQAAENATEVLEDVTKEVKNFFGSLFKKKQKANSPLQEKTSSKNLITNIKEAFTREESPLEKLKILYKQYLHSFMGYQEDHLKSFSLVDLIYACKFPTKVQEDLVKIARQDLSSKNPHASLSIENLTKDTQTVIARIKNLLQFPEGENTKIFQNLAWKAITSEISKQELIKEYLPCELLKNFKKSSILSPETAWYLTHEQIQSLPEKWFDLFNFGKYAEELIKKEHFQKNIEEFYLLSKIIFLNFSDISHIEQPRFKKELKLQPSAHQSITENQLSVLAVRYGPALQSLHARYKHLKEEAKKKNLAFFLRRNLDFVEKLSHEQKLYWDHLLFSTRLKILTLPESENTVFQGLSFSNPEPRAWKDLNEQERKDLVQHVLGIEFLNNSFISEIEVAAAIKPYFINEQRWTIEDVEKTGKSTKQGIIV